VLGAAPVRHRGRPRWHDHRRARHCRAAHRQRRGASGPPQDRALDPSNRRAEFAAAVLRERVAGLKPTESERTIFANRSGGALSPFNVRRTFRSFLELAQLTEEGITLRWYRRTGATVIARGASTDAAASFLGHGSTAITEGHYIEPDRTVDRAPADLLERTLRRANPDGALLALAGTKDEDELMSSIDEEDAEAA
jgi:hypothetical protein